MSSKAEAGARGVLSLEGVDAARVHPEWQGTNTLWAITQRLVALLMFLLAVPLMLVLYVPVRVSAKAPFFFRQERLGIAARCCGAARPDRPDQARRSRSSSSRRIR